MIEQQPRHLVFSYGTLKRGFCNYYNMERTGIQYCTVGVTVDKFPLYCDSAHRYRPCLVNNPGIGHRVVGEVYEVSDDALTYLDVFEHVPSDYTRGNIIVMGEDDAVYHVNVYFIVNDTIIINNIKEGNINMYPEYTMDLHSLYDPRYGHNPHKNNYFNNNNNNNNTTNNKGSV
eukprot:GHVR01004986.1.p1 GENE.GHVR01004986.1~~GHVR01004986.1.p1  ORF type:complete len:174 (+),score=40.40 GHVR01004986.1:268-789(+)